MSDGYNVGMQLKNDAEKRRLNATVFSLLFSASDLITYFVQMTSLLLSFVILILTTYIGPTSLNLTIACHWVKNM